jgi:hypothetical protein
MTRLTTVVLGCVVASIGTTASGAQTIAQRVARAPEGTVRMSFAARPGVCGNGRNITSGRGSDEWESGCDSGPVRVALTVRGGAVTSIRSYVGGRWRAASRDITDLGDVPAREAADYLLGLAGKLDSEGGRDAIFPATLADSAVVWPRLIQIAKDPSTSTGTRKQAVFWLGQAAGEAATSGLDSLVYADALDRSVKEQAVFALSQRPREEGVPALIRAARSHKDPAIRKKALFWLGQSEDPRAIALFEELLKK